MFGAGTAAGLLLPGFRFVETTPEFALLIAGRCSFCGSDRERVPAVVGVRGRPDRICSECLELCAAIVSEHLQFGPSSREDEGRALAAYHGLPWVDLQDTDLAPNVVSLIARDEAYVWGAVPLRRDHSCLVVAVADPGLPELMRRLSERAGVPVSPVIASRRDIVRCLDRHRRYFRGAPDVPRSDEQHVGATLEKAEQHPRTTLEEIGREAEQQALIPRKRSPPREGLRCSFCDRDRADSCQLIAGPDVYICDACVLVAEMMVRGADL